MDRRIIRNKKNKPRNARPYDRANQSLFGKVASKVKGLLNPSWIFNVSQWMSAPTDEQPGSSQALEEESGEDEEMAPQPSPPIRSCSKRPRLQLHDHPGPSRLSEGTQTWLDAPASSSLFNPASHLQPPGPSIPLMENKEAAVIMNGGDDHSENSEGSASTSGCSSLVSSHKDRIGPNLRLNESALANLSANLKSTAKGMSPNMNTSRMSLWSGGFSPSAKFQRRTNVANTSTPGFNVSAFVGPTKVNTPADRKVASPFYQGKTSFGGASSSRRLPVSVAPYQVDRQPRNQIKVRPSQIEDNLEGMSSAAKRILLTLEKMSSPVTDAKKIPNTNRSPVDLSLYLMPPKHRSNVTPTPVGSRGPPIANISTISKLTTLKSCGSRKFQKTSMDSLSVAENSSNDSFRHVIEDAVCTALGEDVNKDEDIYVDFSRIDGQKSGGGKMRNKLTQQHQPSAGSDALELNEFFPLPNVPLPISSLPKFSFDPKPDRSGIRIVKNKNSKGDNGFVFSNPIEILPKSNLSTNSIGNIPIEDFNFSSPIQLCELPPTAAPSISTCAYGANSISTWNCTVCCTQNTLQQSKCSSCGKPKTSSVPTVTVTSNAATAHASSTSTWDCSECWIKNQAKDLKCIACENPKTVPGVTVASTASSGSTAHTSSSSTWECSACWVKNPAKELKCIACETPKTVPTGTAATTASSVATANASSTSTWECSACWVKNSAKELKCIACETPKAGVKQDSASAFSSVGSVNSVFGTGLFTSSITNSPGGFKMPGLSTTSETQAVSFGGFQIPVSKASTAEKQASDSSEKTNLKENVIKGTDVFSLIKSTGSSVKSSDISSSATKSLISDKNNKTTESSTRMNGPDNSPNTSDKENSKNALSFKANSSTPSLSGSGFPKPIQTFSDWDCDTCFARNAHNKQRCTSCDTLKPTKGNTSGLKGSEGFNFGAPLQSSPITFKFNSSSTATTTSSLALGATSSVFSSTIAPSFTISSDKSKTNLPTLTPNPIVSVPESGPEIPPKSTSDAPTSETSNTFSFGNSAPTTQTSNPKLSVPESGADTSVKSTSETAPVSETSTTFSLGKTAPSTTQSNPSSQFSLFAPVTTNTVASTTSTNTVSNTAPSIFTFGASTTSQPAKLEGVTFKGPETKPNSLVSSDSLVFNAPTTATTTTASSQPLQTGLKNPEGFKFGLLPVQNSPSAFQFNSSATTIPSTTPSTFTLGVTSSTTSAFFPSKTTLSSSTIASDKTKPSLSSLASIPKPTVPQFGLDTTVKPTSEATSIGSSSAFSFGNSAPITSQSNPSSNFSFFPSTTTTATTVLNTAPGIFSFGASNTSQPAKPGGFTFKGPENKPNPLVSSNSLTFNAPTTAATTAASTVFKFGSGAPAAPSGGFNFLLKTDAANPAPTNFAFGTGPASTNASAFSGFQTTNPAPAAPVFQFGSQPDNNPPAAPIFGSTSGGFSFGAKSETTNQLPTTQAPASGFGMVASPMQPVFGSTTTVPEFGKTDKPTGFSFGAPQASSTPIYQFGAPAEKKQATSTFAFGTSAPENPAQNSFSTPFNINTPTNFNFGATSSQTGPFQFAAAASSDNQGSAPRKIRKALRRVKKE